MILSDPERGDKTATRCGPKRLEKGRFRPAFSKDGRLSSIAIEAAELALIIEGIELAGARRSSALANGDAPRIEIARDREFPMSHLFHRNPFTSDVGPALVGGASA